MKLRNITLIIILLSTFSSFAQTGYKWWYRDADNDTYGVSNDKVWASYPPTGYVYRDGDCNDDPFYGPSINPGAPEICDGKDNNCDGLIDNDVNVGVPPNPVENNYCDYTVLVKPAVTGGNVTYYWQSTATGISTTGTSDDNTITRHSGDTYYLRAKVNGQNCWSAARQITYSIVTTPTEATGNDKTICSGENVTLTATPGGSGTTIRWYNDPL